MADQLLTTKLYIPPQGTKKLPRQRLLAQLTEGLSEEKRLILVCAPAGYGKTALVSEWIRTTEEAGRSSLTPQPHFSWVSLDEGDNDPAVFFSYMVAGLQRALPGIGQTAQALMQSPQAFTFQPALSALVNELAQQSLPLVLVLDDYQVIHTKAIHDSLLYLIEHAPPGFHLALTTRSDPPLPLHRCRARGQMVELRLEDLRFTRPEVSALMSAFSGLELGENEIEILAERTEGWVAGIQMAALSLRGKPDPARWVQSLAGSHRYILDYLAEEVLKDQPLAVQKFLVQTSVLGRFCASLCDAVVEPDASMERTSQDILDYLDRANLFLIPLDDERTWFRYHHLFADLLRVRLKQQPAAARPLHRRAADWFEANGWISEAVQQAIAGEDFEKAAGLVEQHTLRLFAQGELHPLLAWIRLLPKDLAAHRPWLSIYQAWALVFSGSLSQIEPLLQQAEQAMQAEPPEERRKMQAEMIAIRGMAALTSGNLPGVMTLVDLPEDAIPPERLFARSVIRWSLGYAWRMQGKLREAASAFEDVLQLGRQMGNNWTILTASVDLGMVLRQSGRLREAEHVYREGLRQVQESATDAGFLGRLESFLASAVYEQNHLEEAQRLVESSIEHNRRWDNPNHTAHGYWIQARISLALGDAAAVEAALQQAETSMVREAVVATLKGSIESTRVRFWLAQGQVPQAQRWLMGHPIPDEALDHPSELTETIILTAARVHLAARQAQAALELLEKLEPAVRAADRMNALIETLTLKSLAFADRTAAFHALSEALALGLPAGYVRVYLDEGQALGSLLEEFKAWLQRKETQAISQQLPSLNTVEEMLQLFGSKAGSQETLTPKTAPAPDRSGVLTAREVEILRCMAEGLTNQAIGQRLYISPGTVKAHSAAIYRKLDVLNRAEAISLAKDLGLI